VLTVAEDLRGAGFVLQSELSEQHGPVVAVVTGPGCLKALFVPLFFDL
jgi:hypothetical protein